MVEPGDVGVDSFFSEFLGEVFVVLAELVSVWGVVKSDENSVAGDTDVPIQSIEEAFGQMGSIPIAHRLIQALA